MSDRSIAAQYPNRMSSENVTSKSGDNRFYHPINSLMSALYHRFGFLDLANNEIGIGHKTGRINSYVYVMGNTALTKLCQQPEFNANGQYNFNMCVDAQKRIDKKQVDKHIKSAQRLNTKIVLWPAKNATGIPPVFFEESPDPLPHHSVSGYPVSVQFNPAYFINPPKVTAFSLKKLGTNQALNSITILNENNDPNQQLTSFQHALFPSKRLDWNTQYSATLNYINQDNQTSYTLNWSFKTKSFTEPLITILPSTNSIKVVANQAYILYFPPRHAQDTDATLNLREYKMNIKLNYIDNNTLYAFISNKGKAEITFHNKTIKLATD